MRVSARGHRSTIARPRWVRRLAIGLVGAAAAGAWAAYAISTIDLQYELTGSLVLAGPSLAMTLDPGSDVVEPAVPYGDASDLAARLSRTALQAAGDASVALEPISPDLLHVRVQAASGEEAERGLDATLSSATSDSGDVVVIFRSSDLVDPAGQHRAGALLGIASPASTWAARWAPPPAYLFRVAGLQIEGDEALRYQLGGDAEVRVTQTPYDSAPVVELSVVGAEPAATTGAYAAAVARLGVRIAELQDDHAVPPGSQLRLVPLQQPAAPSLLMPPLLTPFFHLSSILLVLMTLVGIALERVARRPYEVRR